MVLKVYLNNESCSAGKNTRAGGFIGARTGESVVFCKTKYKDAPTGIVPVGAYAVRGIVLRCVRLRGFQCVAIGL